MSIFHKLYITQYYLFYSRKYGGAEGDRTPDLVNAIHALSQLSYGPNKV